MFKPRPAWLVDDRSVLLPAPQPSRSVTVLPPSPPSVEGLSPACPALHLSASPHEESCISRHTEKKGHLLIHKKPLDFSRLLMVLVKLVKTMMCGHCSAVKHHSSFWGHSETDWKGQRKILCEINIHKIMDQILRMKLWKMIFLDTLIEGRLEGTGREGRQTLERARGTRGRRGPRWCIICQVMIMALQLGTAPPSLVFFFSVSWHGF